jgi:hypothetical protein
MAAALVRTDGSTSSPRSVSSPPVSGPTRNTFATAWCTTLSDDHVTSLPFTSDSSGLGARHY